MYSSIELENVEPRELEEEAPTLLSVGRELKPEKMRPNVWHYERGEENAYHRQGEQEELYVVLEGTVDVTIERDDERDVITLSKHDVLVVPPESWRQLRAVEESRVLAVGAPNVPDDGMLEE
ncbi:cupin domain-containing protein [Natrarchaeobius oligotrophus]|uniref:Cupin domain-containing protein n=1 Tax=Natrarchaeobius chitinivorans TaxID=1679083 RepID=A0A3N6PM39_NATCH|nr:cupin domain-containing protein [Natrarchaeobius chitinivorans]RQH00116.1 cupin domain-containing protein [Natrarchaeobius chitinivorans]